MGLGAAAWSKCWRGEAASVADISLAGSRLKPLPREGRRDANIGLPDELPRR